MPGQGRAGCRPTAGGCLAAGEQSVGCTRAQVRPGAAGGTPRGAASPLSLSFSPDLPCPFGEVSLTLPGTRSNLLLGYAVFPVGFVPSGGSACRRPEGLRSSSLTLIKDFSFFHPVKREAQGTTSATSAAFNLGFPSL